MKSNRDNFSKNTSDIMAKRAGYLCSNPECRISTIGSHEDFNKATTIGIAAHITAASERGPRYNEKLTPEERSDIRNGIWLCSNCASLIDKDEKRFSVELLHEWKGGAEMESRLILRNRTRPVASNLVYSPVLEADLTGGGRTRLNQGISLKNPIEIHDGQRVIVPGLKPIIHWALEWRYQLIIYNNSSFSAYNIRIESIGSVHFNEMDVIERTNNIPSLSSKELTVKFKDWVESDHTIADEMLETRYPKKFDQSLKLKISYSDELRKEHITCVEFQDGEIVNNIPIYN